MKPFGQTRITGAYRSTRSPSSAPGAYKIGSRSRAMPLAADPLPRSELRTQRILESLRQEIVEGGGENLRIRQVFQTPREIYRIELELPELGYQRTILLDRDALEELLEVDEVRELVSPSPLGH